MLIEIFIVGKVADKLTGVFSSSTDNLNDKVMFRTFFTVISMSA